ncbi:MAG: hypothetical protein KTR23_05080 [Rhodospirillales bacterium]|nr:hypothetical protein [Rhodospirillales bacterium]
MSVIVFLVQSMSGVLPDDVKTRLAMTLDPDLQNHIKTALENVDKVSKTILARRDLSDVKPGNEVIPTSIALEKKLNAVLVAKGMTASLGDGIVTVIDAISPGLEKLHISEAKMSAKTGQLNTSKKVPSEVSTAFANLLKETLASLNAVETLIKVQEHSSTSSGQTIPDAPPKVGGDYQKTIRAELEKLKAGVTKITINKVVRAG